MNPPTILCQQAQRELAMKGLRIDLEEEKRLALQEQKDNFDRRIQELEDRGELEAEGR